MEPKFFKTPAAFRSWLKKNHEKEKELIVGFYKKDSGKKSITWPEAVDQALCFGWIDGIRKSYDEESYTNRFTPRRPQSNWSAININKVSELSKQGLMEKAGLDAFEKRKEDKSAIYSYENRPLNFSGKYQKQFKENKKAWTYFNKQPPSYRKLAIYWVMSAKQITTQIKRLERLILASENEKRI